MAHLQFFVFGITGKHYHSGLSMQLVIVSTVSSFSYTFSLCHLSVLEAHPLSRHIISLSHHNYHLSVSKYRLSVAPWKCYHFGHVETSRVVRSSIIIKPAPLLHLSQQLESCRRKPIPCTMYHVPHINFSWTLKWLKNHSLPSFIVLQALAM